MSRGPARPVVNWPCRRGLFGGAWLPVAIVLAMAAGPALAAPSPPDAAAWARLVEEDWLRQAETRAAQPPPTSPRADAAGACDGVKNGQYGFHTGQEANPWWQVDLGRSQPIARVVVYNRLDYAPGLHNADNLVLATSDDGSTWTRRYDNGGKFFGGVTGAKPLEVVFAAGEVRARFVRLLVPSDKPIYFHLDEVEVYGPADPAANLALGRPADQSSLSQWSTAKVREGPEPGAAYPTRETIERGRRLAADLGHAGVDIRPHQKALDEAASRLAALPADAPADARRALYLDARWAVRRLAFANPLLNFDRLVFVKRFTQETYPDVCLNHMPWVSRPGGDICVLTGLDGPREVRPILAGALGPGHVHGMDLWWDADRVVFGYAKARSDQPPAGWLDRATSYRLRRSEEPIHIFEIGIDGRGLRQLTRGEWSDLDPTYLPGGDIAFVSERCGYSLQCNEYDKDETSCNLYVMRPDGARIRRLSVTKDGDYLPHTLDDGTIGYTRWEYQERGWANVQSLWFVRPDGTGADALFKQHFNNPWAVEEARSIPGSNKFVAVATGHHTLPAGPVVILDPAVAMNDPAGIRIVTPGVRPPEGGMAGTPVPEGGVADAGGLYMTPWPLSDKYFIVSYGFVGGRTAPADYGIYLIDVFGTKELVYRDPKISCFVPIPLRPRPRPPILPDVTDPLIPYAVCTAGEVGRGVDGVDPKSIRFIRIAQGLAWPYDNEHGGRRYETDAKRIGINWTPVRILGTVPVEADGSAHFSVPADTPVYFQLLDENQMELRRMRSFISFQPGETRGCTGCHETRAAAPAAAYASAHQRKPSVPAPPPWGDRPLSFLRDVQPVLDAHCVRCHGGLKPAAGLDYSAGLTALHNRAYDTILAAGLVAISNKNDDAKITLPLAFGSHKSKLVTVLRGEVHAKRVSLSKDDWLRLVTWIDANAPYHDAFIDKRPAKPPYDLAADAGLARAIAAVHKTRCAACHKPADVTRIAWIDIRRPEQSLFLAAPLAKEAGGTGGCEGAAYKDSKDPDYQAVRQAVEAAVKHLWESPRRDVKALVDEAPPVARN